MTHFTDNQSLLRLTRGTKDVQELYYHASIESLPKVPEGGYELVDLGTGR
jgi:hypothetical protein